MRGQETLTQTLGLFVARTQPGDIPADVSARAKVSLLHNLVLAVAGRSREKVAGDMAKKLWAQPSEATLLHDGTKASLEAAAFANGALIHARSQDDTHAPSTSHPGGVVMPVALALAEFGQASGADFLTAVVLGYEILCRVGRDFDERLTARGFRAAPVAGVFGAAAAGARLLKLSPEIAAHALGLSAHLAGGLAQVWQDGSPEGPLQLGFAARNGLLAARSAACGAAASPRALEGASGFFRAYADTAEPAREALNGLGHDWQFSEVTVKAHPVCAILQGPLDSLSRLMQQARLETAAIESITLSLNPYEARYPGIDNPRDLASATSAKMSAQFSLALAVQEGAVKMEGLDRFADPKIRVLSQKVRVVADPAIEVRASKTSVRLMDGRVLADEITSAVGQPAFGEMIHFCRRIAAEIDLRSDAFDDLMSEVDRLDAAPDLKGLFASLSVDHVRLAH